MAHMTQVEINQPSMLSFNLCNFIAVICFGGPSEEPWRMGLGFRGWGLERGNLLSRN